MAAVRSNACRDHDATSFPVYCNRANLPSLPDNSVVKLRHQHLTVHTSEPKSHQCHVTLSQSPHKHTAPSFGPFSVKQDQQIDEVYSCSVSADRRATMLSVSLRSKPCGLVPVKSYQFSMAIFDTQSTIGIQRTDFEPGIFVVGSFHATESDVYFVLSYDGGSPLTIASKRLSSRAQKEAVLDIIDHDCENLLTLSATPDFLILQVLEADLAPPYCTSSTYLLSPETLAVVKRVSLGDTVAPCHTQCTLNYLPDHSFQEGYLRPTFPKFRKDSLTRGKKNAEEMALVKLPLLRVQSLQSLARNAVRFNMQCERCFSDLQLPELLQAYVQKAG